MEMSSYLIILMLSIVVGALSIAPGSGNGGMNTMRAVEKRDEEPNAKYFREADFNSHYDKRFGIRQLFYYDQKSHLSTLIRAYLTVMDRIGVETWLMHGSLLGWYWNHKIMPWDPDLDVQISERSMQYLSKHYNMTTHRVELPSIGESREFLLEVNPNWTNSSVIDTENKIDARWLDTTTGLYVDITALRRDEKAGVEGVQGTFMCKDGHRYKDTDIFPLLESTFEDVPVRVPFAYANVLIDEYGNKSLSDTVYNNHEFDDVLKEWLPLPQWWF